MNRYERKRVLIKMARTLKFNKNFTNYNDILSEKNYKMQQMAAYYNYPNILN